MQDRYRRFIVCSILSILISTLTIFIVFAIRTILDPMYRDPVIIGYTKQIFYVFVMPFYEVEKHLVGLNPDGSHVFHLIWTPVGIILSGIYIAIMGNLIYLVFSLIKKKKDINPPQND